MHIVNSPSQLFSVQPFIILPIFMFVLPITSYKGGNRDTLDWRGRVAVFKRSVVRRKELGNEEKVLEGGVWTPPTVPRSACLWFWRTSWRFLQAGIQKQLRGELYLWWFKNKKIKNRPLLTRPTGEVEVKAIWRSQHTVIRFILYMLFIVYVWFLEKKLEIIQ